MSVTSSFQSLGVFTEMEFPAGVFGGNVNTITYTTTNFNKKYLGKT